jgi:hypothetical protein
MLRVLLAFALLLGAWNISAQTDQGRWLVSGILDADLSLDDDDDATFFSLKPGVAKFVVDRLALGGNIGIDYREAGTTSTTNVTIGPYARWYILGGGVVQMFLQAEANYIYQKTGDVSDNGFEFFGAPGLSYFISDNVSVDVQMGYNYRTFGDEATSENIRLLAGFQIFL